MKGFVTLSKVQLADGKIVSTQQAVDYGWIRPVGLQKPGWDLERHEVPLGHNLFVDDGRQLLAYCFGGKAPLSNFFCQKFGVGTGTTAPKVTDAALENSIFFNPPTNTVVTKEIDGVDFPTAFVARVDFTLASSEANGYLITEMGLFSGNDTLIARKTNVGINKSSDFSPTLTWRIRF